MRSVKASSGMAQVLDYAIDDYIGIEIDINWSRESH
jgi:hypothetical protein